MYGIMYILGVLRDKQVRYIQLFKANGIRIMHYIYGQIWRRRTVQANLRAYVVHGSIIHFILKNIKGQKIITAFCISVIQ